MITIAPPADPPLASPPLPGLPPPHPADVLADGPFGRWDLAAPRGGPPDPPDANRPAWSWRRRVSTLAFAAMVVALAFAGYGPAGGILAGFVLITPLELAFRRHRQPVRRPQLRTDMTHLLFSNLLATGFLVAAIVAWAILLLPTSRSGMTELFATQPVLLQAVEAFLLFEFLGYVAHRLMHEVPLFWKFHAVHHSSERLDWISGARVHPVEGLIIGTVVAPPLLVLGVRAPTLGALTLLLNLWATLLHANIRWRFRWMDGWWGTPELHHWHHSNHPEARNKNYSAFLPVLDRMFGTYYQPTDRRPEIYGIDAPMPATWWQQMRHPFRRRRPGGWETGPAASPRPERSPAAVHGPPSSFVSTIC